MEKQVTSHIVKGAILGGISILFSIIIYVFNLYTTQWLSWLSYAILIGGIIYVNVLFANQTSGSFSSGYVSSTKLTFNPSTGTLTTPVLTTTSDEKLKTNILTFQKPTVQVF